MDFKWRKTDKSDALPVDAVRQRKSNCKFRLLSTIRNGFRSRRALTNKVYRDADRDRSVSQSRLARREIDNEGR